MRLKGSIPIESHYEQPQKTNFSFFRKVQISLTLGLIISFLLIGSIIFLRQYLDVKHQLESQGAVLTSNLAHNAEPFIVNYDKDQLNQFLEAMLGNPLVLFSGIINSRFEGPTIDVLKKQSSVNLKFVTEVIRKPNYGAIQTEDFIAVNDSAHNIKNVIYCISPIISDYKFPDDETTILFDQPKHKGIIGYSVIAYRMPWERLFSIQIQWVIILFGAFSIILGTLLGKIIANQFTKRIKKIHEAIENYSFGDVLVLSDGQTDELSDIAYSVQGMTELVSVQLNRITSINKSLEQTIKNRVIEIQELNEVMKKFSNNQRAFIAQTTQEVKSLMEFLPLLEKNKKAYENIMAHVNCFLDRMIQMLKDNEEFSMIKAVESVDVSELLNELQPLFEALCNKNNNELKMGIENSLILETDQLLLKQSLIQLTHNATKYTTNGHIEWQVFSDKQQMFFKITDSGIGMDQDMVNNILTELDKNDMQLIDAFTTLGLGLVLIHRFCRNTQAKLICMSEKGAGTKIEIIHPLRFTKELSQSKVVACFIDDPSIAKKIKIKIQAIPKWGCNQYSDASSIKAMHPRAVCIDFSHIKLGLEKLQEIKALCPEIEIMCYRNEQIIVVKHLIQLNAELIIETIEAVLENKDHKQMVYLNGFSEDVVKRVSKGSQKNVMTAYAYNETIDLRVVHENKYEMITDRDASVVVVESDDSLVKLIQDKGCRIDNLETLGLFKG